MQVTAHEIATCKRAIFLDIVSKFESDIKFRFQLTNLFRSYTIQQDILTDAEFKFSFLQIIQDFINGKITEDQYYNSQLRNSQQQAIKNIFDISNLQDKQIFSYVQDNQIFEHVSIIQVYILNSNITLLSHLNEFSVEDQIFSITTNTEFCKQLFKNVEFINDVAFETAFIQENISYFESIQGFNSSVNLRLILEDFDCVSQNIRINFLIQKLQANSQYESEIYNVYDSKEISYDLIQCQQTNQNNVQNDESDNFIDEDLISNHQEEQMHDFIIDTQIINDLVKDDLFQNYGFFIPSQTSFNLLEQNNIKKLGGFNKYQKSITEGDSTQFQLLAKANSGLRNMSVCGIHLAIIFNNLDALKFLIKHEKFSTTNCFYTQIPSGQWVIVPEKATCLHIAVLFQQYHLISYFIEQAVQPAQNIYPLDYAGYIDFQKIWKPGKTEYSSNIKASLQSNNLRTTTKLLQYNLFAKDEISQYCRDILQKEKWNQSQETLLVYGFSNNVVVGDQYDKFIQVTQLYQPKFTKFQQVFGVWIGEVFSTKQNNFVQNVEISIFFDNCIEGTVSEQDLKKYGTLFDKRLTTQTIIMGFTGYHYIEYYNHLQYKNLLNLRSQMKTVVRFKDFDILFEKGLKVSDLGGRLQPEADSQSVIPQLKGQLFDSMNIHFYCLLQQDMKALEDFISGQNQNNELLQQLISKQDGLLPAQIKQYNIYNQQILNRLTNSVFVYFNMKEEDSFNSELIIQETDYIINAYILKQDQFQLPDICQFNVQEIFFDICKYQQLKSVSQKEILLIETRTTNFSQQIYNGFIGIFYAILNTKLDNIKFLLEKQWNKPIQQNIIIYENQKFLFVPEGFQALHFAKLINSPHLQLIESYYKAKQLDYENSFCALSICQDYNFSKKFFEYEQDNIFMVQQILYACVTHNKQKQLEFLLQNSQKQQIIISALTQPFNQILINQVSKDQTKYILDKYIAQKLLNSNFDKKFCQYYSKDSQEQLEQLFFDYINPNKKLTISFDFNTHQQSIWFEQAQNNGNFDYTLVKYKNTSDQRKSNGKNIYYGFSALFYAITKQNSERIFYLYKLEHNFMLQFETFYETLQLERGTTGFKLLVLLNKFEIIEKLYDTQQVNLRKEIESNNFFINYLLENNIYNETIVRLWISCTSEQKLLNLLEQNQQTVLYQKIVEKINGSIAFHRYVVQSNKFNEQQTRDSKFFLLERDQKTLKQTIGEDQFIILLAEEEKKQLEYTQKQHVMRISDTKTKIDYPKHIKQQSDEQTNYYISCATEKITGLERFIGLPDQRFSDPKSKIYNGFTGLFYAIQANNIDNIRILIEKEGKIYLQNDVSYVISQQEVILRAQTQPIQFAVMFNLEKQFPNSVSIPKDSAYYFIFADRFPCTQMDSNQINYCIQNNKNDIISQLYQRNISEQTAISMLQSNLKIQDIYIYIAKFYYSKDVYKALFKKCGQTFINGKDLDEITKSIGNAGSKDFQNCLVKDMLEKNFNRVKEKFRTEKYSVVWRDAIICGKYIPRGSTVMHILPYTSLEIVQFITQKKDYVVDYSDNRFGDSFIDISMQIISNSAFIVLKQYGPQYIEKNFKYALSKIIQFESCQMLDLLIKFVHRLKQKPLDSLDPVFVGFDENSKFQKAALDALYSQKLCNLLRDQPETIEKAIVLQANAGILKWRGEYLILNQFKELGESSQLIIFEGFDCVNNSMIEKWEAVGDLVMGELGDDMDDMFEQDQAEEKQRQEQLRLAETEFEKQKEEEAQKLKAEIRVIEQEKIKQEQAKIRVEQAGSKKVEYCSPKTKKK
ncbi:hypothetical protein SS50377_22236 [Spironucleus salmonicida]|uniref:Ankyrin repeat-containing protein n=1 Tax=Spironucleus salmonicida TaxID=348837 RepID=V6LCU4_9EUKA|nr:hypothetical protein SS50377_22236 [Spironucleus salmonicida]|eukprot:EST42272.1 Hypothetical protein SS50377_18572 [Spironucleus salmonicida]